MERLAWFRFAFKIRRQKPWSQREWEEVLASGPDVHPFHTFQHWKVVLEGEKTPKEHSRNSQAFMIILPKCQIIKGLVGLGHNFHSRKLLFLFCAFKVPQGHFGILTSSSISILRVKKFCERPSMERVLPYKTMYNPYTVISLNPRAHTWYPSWWDALLSFTCKGAATNVSDSDHHC